MKQQDTQRVITEAFLRLLAEKSFDKITVREIVEECGFTRNTFYYYFDDIYDIVDSLLSDEMERLLASSGKITPQELLLHIVQLSKEHPTVVLHLYRSPKRDELGMYFDRALKVAVDRCIDSLSSGAQPDPEDRRLLSSVLRHSLQGVICDWLDSGMRTPLEENVRRLEYMFDGIVARAIHRSCLRSGPHI